MPITKSGLKAFKDMRKKVHFMVDGSRKQINVSAEQMHQRALALAKVGPEVKAMLPTNSCAIEFVQEGRE